MIKVRNALAAGTMMAAALIAPMTTPTAFAVADTTTTLTSVQKPCSEYKNPQKCREWRKKHHKKHHKDHWKHDHWDHKNHKNHKDHKNDGGMSENTGSGHEGGARVND